jgi:hypothetical protein
VADGACAGMSDVSSEEIIGQLLFEI